MNTIGLLFALGASVTWGMVYTLDQRILADISPIKLTFLAALVAALLTLPFVIKDIGSLRSVASMPATTLALIFVSIALGALANFFIYSGIQHLGASVASVFEISYPFFVVFFSLLIFGGNVSLPFIIGGAFMFVGAAIITLFA
jgi:drug/metabolite transporter (DMT)-like permease